VFSHHSVLLKFLLITYKVVVDIFNYFLQHDGNAKW